VIKKELKEFTNGQTATWPILKNLPGNNHGCYRLALLQKTNNEG
jgi:hypothetical protein